MSSKSHAYFSSPVSSYAFVALTYLLNVVCVLYCFEPLLLFLVRPYRFARTSFSWNWGIFSDVPFVDPKGYFVAFRMFGHLHTGYRQLLLLEILQYFHYELFCFLLQCSVHFGYRHLFIHKIECSV